MPRVHHTTPAADGFHMPGEHAPQDEVWMVWPERPDNWREGGAPAQACFAAVAEAIVAVTPVTVAASAGQYAAARSGLPAAVRVVEMSTDDSWMRDIGPTFVVDGRGGRRGIQWEFNAWGGHVDGLYASWDRDNAVAGKVCEMMRDDSYRPGIVLEGGAIHTDGDGTLFTTEECLLHPSRNPDLTKAEIEAVLKDFLGVDKVIWLPAGLVGDETNGHVDNLMHVVRPGEVVLSWTDDPDDVQYAVCRSAFDVLRSTPDARGRALKVHKIPLPGPLYMSEAEAAGVAVSEGMDRAAGQRLAGSYANFLITNGRIVLPLLDPARDTAAREVLEVAFPGYEIVGVPAREILLGGGNIHCITQQVPAA